MLNIAKNAESAPEVSFLRSAYEGSLAIDNDYGNRNIPCVRYVGNDNLGLFCIPPFGGSKWEPKTQFFLEKCREDNHSFVSFGYSDFESDTKVVADLNLMRMLNDGETIFQTMTQGDQIIVASSFGSNIALRLALTHPDRIKGLVLVSPGIEVERDLLGCFLRDERRRAQYENEGTCTIYAPYHTHEGDALRKRVIVRRDMVHQAAALEVFKHTQQVALSCPTVILHDPDDERVPFSTATELQSRIDRGLMRSGAMRNPRIISTIGSGHDHEKPRDKVIIWSHVERLMTGANLG
jgi:pimeloyl-ACP methyl ester carboxylesterase